MAATNTESDVYVNKIAIMQILAGLINNPLLFVDNKYKFDIKDFPEQFHKILFGAIEHLAHQGMGKISYIDIDQFLKPYTAQYQVFVNNRGVDYIQKILHTYDKAKFDYYYNTLKKYSLLNFLNNQGINTLDIYDPNIISPTAQNEMQQNFDALSVNDILAKEEIKFLEAKEVFGSNSDIVENRFGDGIQELKEKYKETPEMGLSLCSPILTTLYRGQRLGCLVMESAPSGVGKTRRAIGEACHLSVGQIYNTISKQWEDIGFTEPVLVINTELDLEEVQTIAMAYVSGVSESHILDGKYNNSPEELEEERVDKANQLLKKAELYFVSVTNFDCDDIINIIKRYHQRHKVNYVYFDYLGENLKMLAEGAKKTKMQLRTDQILAQFSTSLKDCAKQNSMYIWTSSQLSNGVKEAATPDSSYLKSAKSLAEKLDIGTIMLPVRESDKSIIETYCQKNFNLVPNFVIFVYKIRRGSYQNIRVYVHFDRSTSRLTDCFVTDSNGTMLQIAPTEVEVVLNKTSEEKLENVYQNLDFDF